MKFLTMAAILLTGCATTDREAWQAIARLSEQNAMLTAKVDELRKQVQTMDLALQVTANLAVKHQRVFEELEKASKPSIYGSGVH